MLHSPKTAPRFAPGSHLIVWAGVVVYAAGFVAHRMWAQVPFGRFGESLLLAGLVALLAWPLQRFARMRWAEAIGLVWAVALVALTGALPAVAVMVMAAAAIGIGSAITREGRPALALVLGLACIAGVLGWLLPLRVHHAWTYAFALASIIVVRRRAIGVAWRDVGVQARAAIDATPRASAWAVLALGLASAGAWLPTLQFDDLAYHLGLPWQLSTHGAYALDPSTQVWALAPWAGDVLQAVPHVVAHAEARSAMCVLWLLLAAAASWRIARALGASPSMRWGSVALLASLPMVTALAGGMQTELPAIAVTLALAALVLEPLGHATRSTITGALLFGLLCALKPLHGFAALPILAWAAWRHRAALTPLRIVIALVVVAIVGGASYAYAWHVAGNPVLPLLNGVFQSPYFAPTNFDDGRWHAGLGTALPWGLTFDTATYLEGWDGGLGIVLVALAGAWLLAVWQPRTREIALCATGAIVLPLLPLQYARYVMPGVALLLPACVVAVQSALDARSARALLVGVCVLNVAFVANANWLLHTGGIKRALVALGDPVPLQVRYAPERVLADAIRTDAPSGRVLLLDAATPSIAEFAGRARTTAWYDPRMQATATRADLDTSNDAWAALLRSASIEHVIVRPDAMTPAQRAGLANTGARLERTAGKAQWWRVSPERTP